MKKMADFLSLVIICFLMNLSCIQIGLLLHKSSFLHLSLPLLTKIFWHSIDLSLSRNLLNLTWELYYAPLCIALTSFLVETVSSKDRGSIMHLLSITLTSLLIETGSVQYCCPIIHLLCIALTLLIAESGSAKHRSYIMHLLCMALTSFLVELAQESMDTLTYTYYALD